MDWGVIYDAHGQVDMPKIDEWRPRFPVPVDSVGVNVISEGIVSHFLGLRCSPFSFKWDT